MNIKNIMCGAGGLKILNRKPQLTIRYWGKKMLGYLGFSWIIFLLKYVT